MADSVKGASCGDDTRHALRRTHQPLTSSMIVTDGFEQLTSVLIVDDSDVQREYCAALCRDFGIARIHQASNGREALELIGTLQPAPSLLIVDLEMPTMDGAELLQHLQLRALNVPILVASARESMLIDTVRDMGSALGLNIAGALQKPLSAALLRKALQNCTSARVAPQARAQPSLDEHALRIAIERGEIEVHYQPKVDVRTGIVRGAEALARWPHATAGFVQPDQFIALAERSGLIHELTRHVMHSALLQLSAWHARGLQLSVSINLSPMLLEHSELADDICSLLQTHGIAAEHVIFEITEGSLVTQLGVALGLLARLRLRGFGLSIDDYGKGFSSLQQLARMPFTELKIDREFVHGAHERRNLQVILRTALDMANQLGLVTVAEGVETMQDWRLLQQFGCRLGQGWLIAKAMPADDFLPWLIRHRRRGRQLAEKRRQSSRAGYSMSP